VMLDPILKSEGRNPKSERRPKGEIRSAEEFSREPRGIREPKQRQKSEGQAFNMRKQNWTGHLTGGRPREQRKTEPED